MNTLVKSIMNVARFCVGNSIKDNTSSLTKVDGCFGIQGSILNMTRLYLGNTLQGLAQTRAGSTLRQMHKRGPHLKKRNKKSVLDGHPFMKGVVLKTVIRKPKKPNSANRKCVVVKLVNGKEMTAYVPGEGHNLQEHNIVLCQPGKLKDTPGVKIRCVRGKYDLPHVQKPTA